MGNLVWTIALAWASCITATLTAGNTTAGPGEQGVLVPVALDAETGERVCALMLDVTFDGSALALPEVTVGAAAEAAGKTLVFNSTDPNTVGVIIAGINQNVVADGIVANALFDIGANASPGTYAVSLPFVQLSDPLGSLIDAEAIAGSIQVTGAEGEGEGEGECHSADTDESWTISVPEISRVVGFYNAGEYHVESSTPDGYAPGVGSRTGPPHDSDYNPPDWQIGLTELSRLVAFYNAGGYAVNPLTADGFEPLGAAEQGQDVAIIRNVGTDGTYPAAGGTLDVSVTFNSGGHAELLALCLTENVPEGWTYAATVGDVPGELLIEPAFGDSNVLPFLWLYPPQETLATLTYRVNVPAGESGSKEIAGNGTYNSQSIADSTFGPVTSIIQSDSEYEPTPGCASLRGMYGGPAPRDSAGDMLAVGFLLTTLLAATMMARRRPRPLLADGQHHRGRCG